MALTVRNNIPAMNTLGHLNKNHNQLANSLEKLSTGCKINSSKDNSSGYQIANRMRVQIRALDQANYNAQNGNAMLKVAEGNVESTIEALRTLKEKVVNAANDTNTDADRKAIQKEMDQTIAQIDENALTTFNGKILSDGSHNMKTKLTSTVLYSQSLDEATVVGSKFTELKTRSGEDLNIQETDQIHISYVIDGKTYTTVFEASTFQLKSIETTTAYCGGESVLGVSLSVGTQLGSSHTGDTVYTANAQSAVVITAKTAGVKTQIAGFTISVVNAKTGEVNKAATTALDQFTETIRAQNENSKDQQITLHVGADANQSVKICMTDMRAKSLGLIGSGGNTLDVTSQTAANAALKVIDSALQKCLDQQATIGAVRNRLDFTSNNLSTASENVQSAEATYSDADMAKEMTTFTKNNILSQTAQSMLAQANQLPQGILSLLQ